MSQDVDYAAYDAQKKSSMIAFLLNVCVPGSGYIYCRDWTSVSVCYIGGPLLILTAMIFEKIPVLSGVLIFAAVCIYPISVFHVTRSVSIYNQKVYHNIKAKNELLPRQV